MSSSEGMRIEDVQHWSMSAGIGHIVTDSLGGGWLYTACNSMMTGNLEAERPARVCSKCRAKLPHLRSITEPQRG